MVRFLSPDVRIDLGGIGKGYGLEKIRQILKENRVASAFVSFGESSVLGHGRHPFGNYWEMSVENMFLTGKGLYTFHLKDSCISVSGNHPEYLKRKNKKGHIINPRTGELVTGNKAIAVKSVSAMEAEVVSTAIIAADKLAREDIIAKFAGCEIIEIIYHGENNTDIEINVLNK